MTELPGGLLAQRFGGCRVLGFSVLLAGLLNLVFPFICEMHYGAAAVVRAIQGLALVCNVDAITCTNHSCQL
jgi:ACS family sodium-dependent inorganic phosphate cotransporter